MNAWVQQILDCPQCDQKVTLKTSSADAGQLVCSSCKRAYPVRDGIARFVGQDYWDNFGYQWTHFHRTQIDAYSGGTESLDRFRRETGWSPDLIRGKLVLDLGCGAGRFADVALRFGARVVAVDASGAVDACRRNLLDLGHDPATFEVIQASVYELPFAPGTFDYVYSIGVIQHTPDRKRSVVSLARQLGAGQLALWVYEKSWRSLAGYKYWMRIGSRHLSQRANWTLSTLLVNAFFPVAWWLAKVPKAGRYLVRFLPMAFRTPGPQGTRSQSKEWSLLDTFDNLSPRYDNPITEPELRAWLREGGLGSVERLNAPGLAMVASRPGPQRS